MSTPKVIFVSGNFNILHPGHLRLLRFAKELGGKLVVGVNNDKIGGKAVHLSEEHRLEGIEANNWVDEAVLLEEPVEQYITKLKPDIVVKGKEFEGAYNPEAEVLAEYGGQLIFSSGEVVFSSLDLIKRGLSDSSNIELSYADQFSKRHGFELKDLRNVVDKFSSLKVCVIGDLIVDEYITCDPLGMSQEDPSIVVTPVDSQMYVGGAGIVAAHASGLGADVTFYSVTGDDSASSYAKKSLEKYGVKTNLLADSNRHTTLKQRYRAQNKTMLRVSHLTQTSINQDLQEQILTSFSAQVSKYDLVVFSDFNYGVLPQRLVDEMVAICKKNNVVMIADSQCSSQVGDVSRFKSMDLLTPTEHEARISLRNQEDGLVVIAEELRKKAQVKNVMLKLGAEGVLLLMDDEESPMSTDKLPAFNLSPLDVAGAGDSMLITSGMCFALGCQPWLSALFGNLAASIQVGRVGNTPLSREELIASLQKL